MVSWRGRTALPCGLGGLRHSILPATPALFLLLPVNAGGFAAGFPLLSLSFPCIGNPRRLTRRWHCCPAAPVTGLSPISDAARLKQGHLTGRCGYFTTRNSWIMCRLLTRFDSLKSTPWIKLGASATSHCQPCSSQATPACFAVDPPGCQEVLFPCRLHRRARI